DPKERCYEPIVEGPCLGNLVRFAFSQDLNRCEKFIYGGCQANQNNFQSVEECHELCGGAPPTVGN
ncbi:UNVERIFIED_CONTAM: hypothetical protein GTU68_050505, partial [Idotea baltica]|nr:hypothetical protein [Idotea baltica]